MPSEIAPNLPRSNLKNNRASFKVNWLGLECPRIHQSIGFMSLSFDNGHPLESRLRDVAHTESWVTAFIHIFSSWPENSVIWRGNGFGCLPKVTRPWILINSESCAVILVHHWASSSIAWTSSPTFSEIVKLAKILVTPKNKVRLGALLSSAQHRPRILGES